MFKDKREGWIAKLKVGDHVTIQTETSEDRGKIKTITPLGVMLVDLFDGRKVKLEPNGQDLTGRVRLFKHGIWQKTEFENDDKNNEVQ